MPRKKATHCRYCEKAFEPGADTTRGAHRKCFNGRRKVYSSPEAKAKDHRRRMIAALAKRKGITKEEAEKRYDERNSLKCQCGADKTRLALRCPACAAEVIREKAMIRQREVRGMALKVPKRIQPAAPKPSQQPVVSKLPAGFDTPMKRRDDDYHDWPVRNPNNVQVTRVPSRLPESVRDFFGTGRTAAD